MLLTDTLRLTSEWPWSFPTLLPHTQSFSIIQDLDFRCLDRFTQLSQLHISSKILYPFDGAFLPLVQDRISRLVEIPLFTDTYPPGRHLFSPVFSQVLGREILISCPAPTIEFLTTDLFASTLVHIFGIIKLLQTAVIAAY